ncbi:hypothetical protein EZ313_21230 [Ramlibacter henchirensis]|jgi:hypothetical protein|uniref:GAF domain-containing protein n=1 Tax=Ramlibacter henchirensis TaxID=204072 RepID=A0A4Z0BNR4_9BURK|nr:hypothetical protein [Ramlibacter henchirensis]TFZ00957.1 hypothetical protein EZ313_21230 [Ramlibacter henchirensis]
MSLSNAMLISSAASRSHSSPTSVPGQEEAIRVVLGMLREHGMDVVFVGQFTEGSRRFRVVETIAHGLAAAAATGVDAGDGRSLLESTVVLRDGRVLGKLCCVSAVTDPATSERDLRWLRQGALLVARLLDNEQVLRELSAQSLNH